MSPQARINAYRSLNAAVLQLQAQLAAALRMVPKRRAGDATNAWEQATSNLRECERVAKTLIAAGE